MLFAEHFEHRLPGNIPGVSVGKALFWPVMG
jgi:hypothetical protein